MNRPRDLMTTPADRGGPAPVPGRRVGWTWAAALIDQAMVSGTSFAATVVIGRYADAAELGRFAAAMAVLLAILAAQTSLIVTPYALLRPGLGAGAAAFRGAGAAASVAMALVASALLTLAGTAGWSGMGADYAGVALAMAAVAPALIGREWVRRMAHAHFWMKMVLAIDAVTVAVQWIALGVLAGTGQLTAATGLLAIGAGAGAGALVGATWWRPRTARPASGLDALRRSVAIGRWIAASQVLGVIGAQGLVWIILAISDETTAGLWAACNAVVLLCNPLLLGVGNVLTGRAATTLADGGPEGLRRLVQRMSLVLGGAMIGFCLVLALLDGRIVSWLYGPTFEGLGTVVGVLAASYAVAAVAMVLTDGLRAAGRADAELIAAAMDTTVTVVVAIALLPTIGLVGVAWASLAGGVIALAWQAALFASVLRRLRQGVEIAGAAA